MVEEAQRLATSSGSLTTEAYIASAASEMHACNSDEPSSRRSMEHADRVLSCVAGTDPSWVGHGTFDTVRLQVSEAVNLARFKKPEAADALRCVLEHYGPEQRKSQCYQSTHLARALVQQGEIEEGVRIGASALTLATELGSGQNIRRIRTLYGEDLREHRDHPTVRVLGDRLAEL